MDADCNPYCSDFDYSEDSVVISGKLVTRCVLLNVMGGGKAYNNGLIAYVSRGPGQYIYFALIHLGDGETDILCYNPTRNGIPLCVHPR